MKADPAVQRRLLELADVDAELNRINHRRRTLPELEEIGQAERDQQAKRDSLVSSQTSFDDLDQEVKRLEAEVEQVRAREERDRTLMESGGSAKQMEDLQHELETLSRRRGALEDDLLEVMERREATETEVGYAREAVSAADTTLEDAQRRRDEAQKDLDTAEAKRQAERASFVQEIPENLLTLYDRIRQQRGAGAGLFQAGRCGVCRIELDRAALTHVREAPADEVVRCEECGAIMVRTKESGL
ncbi:hypothetical protein DFQ14_11024 [Halopolyspora algeriensis]|uniref:Uncharacterized protein n=1 Tax=Halopolyspora algeriensis TaxID=1500506 RepID=A0A368VH35_9ACTN|nr:C4-type zinc ribbon domain-containing protein [Halopolyspora algeriensis]RCW40699.1 hypothetical protein DFQ14_11024 [Halopolyspora algeriensis]TQM53378.1 hypothetical protein FHU43_2774 [Halopolyspora algeriensis]